MYSKTVLCIVLCKVHQFVAPLPAVSGAHCPLLLTPHLHKMAARPSPHLPLHWHWLVSTRKHCQHMTQGSGHSSIWGQKYTNCLGWDVECWTLVTVPLHSQYKVCCTFCNITSWVYVTIFLLSIINIQTSAVILVLLVHWANWDLITVLREDVDGVFV